MPRPLTPLRRLARDHAAGRIDRQTYRRRRTELLSRLAAPWTRADVQPTGTARGRPDRRLALVLGLLGAALLLALATWLWAARLAPDPALRFPRGTLERDAPRPSSRAPAGARRICGPSGGHGGHPPGQQRRQVSGEPGIPMLIGGVTARPSRRPGMRAGPTGRGMAGGSHPLG